MSNLIEPMPNYNTWKCPECGYETLIAIERPPFIHYAGSSFIGGLFDMFLGKKQKHKCPECGTEMKIK